MIAFNNGIIYTVNPSSSIVETVIIDDNKIIFAGSNLDAKAYLTKDTKIMDLNGRLMLPGFIDNHTHFIKGGFYLNGINLHNAKSTIEFKKTLENFVKSNKGKWVNGGYWNNEQWENTELPNKEMIDGFTKDTPVFIERFDVHMGLANSLALKLAGITKDTPNPEGGLIEKDTLTGEPTGILKDNAMVLIYKIITEHSKDEYFDAALTAMEEAKKNGITTIHDITLPNDFKTFERIYNENKLTVRIYCRLPISNYKNFINGRKKNDDKLQAKSLKAFSDGSLGSGTAWFFEPYKNIKSNFGLATEIVANGQLEKLAFEADKNKRQICIHAIGDKANNFVLNLYEKIKKENPEWDRRFRIEHAQHLKHEDIPRFSDICVIASSQPYHLADDGNFAEEKIGTERLKNSFAFRSFLNAGVNLCFGSDWPVAPLNAILGIHAAVTRQTSNEQNPEGWIPQQKITVEEAIKCYTINNAYAGFQEEKIGSIEPGKLADLVILSKNILSIEPEKIKDVKVDMTIFDGKIIYES